MISQFVSAAMPLLIVIALATVVHAVLVMIVVGLRRPRTFSSSGALPPVTWFRPLKSGVRDLRGKLFTFLKAVEPADQVLIGVDANSDTVRIAGDLSRDFGNAVRVIVCRGGAAKNPKVSKLMEMSTAARHDLWIVADAESLIDTDFANAFRQDWQQSKADVLTAGYCIMGADEWPQRLDAIATAVTLWPGLELVRTFGKIRFTLGACTGFCRRDLDAIGGWTAIGDELAEDYWLGARLHAMGRSVRLSDAVLSLEADKMTWGDYWRHQLRVAATYRAARPLGTAGMILTRGVTAGVLASIIDPLPGLILFSIALASRVALAECMTAVRGFSLKVSVSLVLLSDAMETLAWLRAWIVRSVWWGGRSRRITWRGKLKE